MNGTDYHRLIWCPYIPDNAESTGSGSQTDDGSMLMLVTHDNIVSHSFVSFTANIYIYISLSLVCVVCIVK